MKELKVSDEAVKKATGKTWKEWFVILSNEKPRMLPLMKFVSPIGQSRRRRARRETTGEAKRSP